ncbi:MAG: hypothetical protein J6U64_01030 [Alphaproteobacteria bacterium]|jgi:hypothetical protein|nr:hypothetical protein [Alphaproteobacteria bacterium]
MKKIVFCFLFCLSACSSGGQSVFFWYRPDTGPVYFAREHSECLAEADWWPWTTPAWPPGSTKLPELRFDNDSDHGIWANFIPYPGAQPVYVNSLAADWSMSVSSYRKCMEKRGYIQRQPMEVRRQVHPQ